MRTFPNSRLIGAEVTKVRETFAANLRVTLRWDSTKYPSQGRGYATYEWMTPAQLNEAIALIAAGGIA